MFVRTQNGYLINLDYCTGILYGTSYEEDGFEIRLCNGPECASPIGKYSDKLKCEKVMDDLADAIKNDCNLFTMPTDGDVYEK